MSALASPTVAPSSDPPSADPPTSDPAATSAAPDPSGSGFTPVPPGSGPSDTASPSPSPSPSPSSSTSAAPSQLCVQVQSPSGAAQVQAGKTAAFVVWVWSVGGPSQDVVITSSVASAKNIASPVFMVCPKPSGAVCNLGSLPANQADELEATSAVGKAATPGEQVKLTAAAKGTGALPDSASLALSVTKSPVTSSSPPAGGQSVPAPPLSLPPLVGLPIPGGVSGNPAGLFPTVAPVPTAGSGIGFPPAHRRGSQGRLVTASATVPLSPRLIGGQLAGLAVLAAAIAIAIARLSLRRARPQDGPEDQRPAS